MRITFSNFAAWIIPLLVICLIAPARGGDDFIPFGTEGMNIPPDEYVLSISPRTIDLLGEGLKKMQGTDRVRLVADLGECGKVGLKYLLPALSDADPLVRAQAAHSVAKIGDASALLDLRPLLTDPEPAVRREAVLAAARLGNIQAVTDALNDSDDTVAAAAIQSATIASQADRIAARLAQWPPRLQPAAAEAIGRLGATTHVDVLLPLLKSDAARHAAALRALAMLKATDQQPAVLAALKDSSPNVRREAIAALAGVSPVDRQQKEALAALNDSDPTVRESAARLLILVPTTDGIDPLRHQLSDEYMPLHDAALRALAAIGKPIIPIGAAMLDDPNPRRREDGSFMLGAVGSDANLNHHINLLDDPDWGVSGQAAKSLYQISPAPSADEAGPKLVAMVHRAKMDSQGISAAASAFLLAGKLHYAPIVQEALPLIPYKIQNNPPDPMRTAGIWAIGIIADPKSSAFVSLRGILTDINQTNDAKFEAVKAMINAKDASAIPLLQKRYTDAENPSRQQVRWMEHFALDRLSGTTTPYIPAPPIKTDAFTSITDLSKR